MKIKKYLFLIFTCALISSLIFTPSIFAKTNNQTQEQAMAKYLTKQGSITYNGEKYSVYLRAENYYVYAKGAVIDKKKHIYDEVYFDKKGNFVNNETTYLDLRRLYVMATNKEAM